MNLAQHMMHHTTIGLMPGHEHLHDFMLSLPERFAHAEGQLIHDGRNQLRIITYQGTDYVVKSYQVPFFINRLVYGFLRASKAERALHNAQRLIAMGVGSPEPVGFINIRNGVLFTHSFMVTVRSECPFRYDMLAGQHMACTEQVCRQIGHQTAVMHEYGMCNLDYSRGNILFEQMGDGSVRLEMVDLNRMRFGKVDMRRGCRNFDRLPASSQMHRWMAEEYAKVRHMDAEECFRLIRHYRLMQKGVESWEKE